MTKKEIVKAISEQMKLTQLQTKEIVQKTFEAIVETLVAEGRIELRNFGVFEVKKRASRKARNPRTGDRVNVPEKFVVTFKPGKKMEEDLSYEALHDAEWVKKKYREESAAESTDEVTTTPEFGDTPEIADQATPTTTPLSESEPPPSTSFPNNDPMGPSSP